jgi:hypothetical protein
MPRLILLWNCWTSGVPSVRISAVGVLQPTLEVVFRLLNDLALLRAALTLFREFGRRFIALVWQFHALTPDCWILPCGPDRLRIRAQYAIGLRVR